MGFFGQEFLDIRTIVPGTSGTVVLDRAAVTAVKSEVDRRLAMNGDNGVILYLPSGVYSLVPHLAHYEPWAGDMEIPPNVTLWFERGARVLLNDSRLVIRGGIVAPRLPIFLEEGSGLVLFANDPEALLPEWWGASSSPEFDSTDAIQRAVDAGSARRMPVKDGGSAGARRPIPVLLHELFHVRRPIVLGREIRVPMRPGTTGVSTFGLAGQVHTTVRGVTRGTAAPSAGLRAGPRLFLDQDLRGATAPSSPWGGLEAPVHPFRVLLHLERAQAATVEDMIVDGSLLADYAVLIEGGVASNGDQLQSHSVAVRNCAVTGARRVQVQVGAPQRIVSRSQNGGQHVPIEANPLPGGDLLGLSIDACGIVCPPELPHPYSVGIQLRALNGVAVRVSNCMFRGYASAFVDALATVALVEGCDFENGVAPGIFFNDWGGDSFADRGTEAPNATDVYLGMEGASSAVMPLQAPSVTPAVAVVGCRSRSERFFSTVSPSPFMARPTRSNLIYGVQHVTRHRTTPSWVRRTSVYWGRQRLSQFAPHTAGSSPPLNRDASLCVVGSSLEWGMKVGMGAAQSVVLACAMPWPEGRLQFIPAQPETPDRRVAITTTTIIFGFVLLALALVGCERSGPPVIDASSDGFDASAANADADVVDFSAYFDRALADVPRPDLTLPPLGDVPVLTNFPPPTQARHDCPAQTEGDPAIAPPRLIFPLSPLRVTSRQPRVVWELARGTNGARVEFCRDRCCTQVIETIDTFGTFASPTAMLPPGVVFWRARGRLGDRVGRDVSFTWEFGVRHRSAPIDTVWGAIRDVNGDGYDDLAASLNGTERGHLRVYWGGADGLRAGRQETMSTISPAASIAFGDFNGDGYADVTTVGATSYGELRGVVMAAYGSIAGIRVEGASVPAGIGGMTAVDINGDGFSDSINVLPLGPVTRPLPRGVVAIFGGPAGLGSGGRQEIVTPDPGRRGGRFGVLGAAGDLNGDGYGDVVIGDPAVGGNDFGGRGRIYVFRGRDDGLDPSPIRIVEAPLWDVGEPGFGSQVHDVGDLNGDRLTDIIVCAERRISAFIYLGSVADYLRYERVLEGDWPPYSLGETGRGPMASFGRPASIGTDLNGDGFAELVLPCQDCLEPEADAVWPDQYGRIFIFDRDARATGIPRWALRPAPVNDRLELLGNLGSDVAGADYDGDGYDDLVIGSFWELHSVRLGGGMVYYRGGPGFPTVGAARLIEDDLPNGAYGLGGIIE